MKTNNLIMDAKADIISRLEEMIGETVYTCDIGFKLTETENANGSWYCNRIRAEEEVKENFDLFGKLAEYMRDNWEDKTNPLLDTELFHVKAMIALYELLFNAAISEWEDSGINAVTVDSDFITTVSELLEDVNENNLF